MLERWSQCFGRMRIPHTRRFVIGCRHHPLPIRTKSSKANPTLVSKRLAQRQTGSGIPNSRRSIIRRSKYVLAIRTEARKMNGTVMTEWFHEGPATLDIPNAGSVVLRSREQVSAIRAKLSAPYLPRMS